MILSNTAIAAFLIVLGPLWAKILFGYYLLGGLLTLVPEFGRRFATLAPNELHIKYWPLIKTTRFSDIENAHSIPLKGPAKVLARLWTGSVSSDDVDVEVKLKRTQWVFMPFPFPFIVPTKRLRLPLKKGTTFVQDLIRCVGEVPRSLD